MWRSPTAPPLVTSERAEVSQNQGQDQGYAAQTSQGAVTLELQPRWEDGHLPSGHLLIEIAATLAAETSRGGDG